MGVGMGKASISSVMTVLEEEKEEGKICQEETRGRSGLEAFLALLRNTNFL